MKRYTYFRFRAFLKKYQDLLIKIFSFFSSMIFFIWAIYILLRLLGQPSTWLTVAGAIAIYFISQEIGIFIKSLTGGRR